MSMALGMTAYYLGVFLLCVLIAMHRGITVWAYLAHLSRQCARGIDAWFRALGIEPRTPQPRVSYARICELERELRIGTDEHKRMRLDA